MTDLGDASGYVGMMKGVIASICPAARVIDLTHAVFPQNVVEASVVLATAQRYFPDRAIFISVVDPGVGSARKIVCMRTAERYYLAPDNGLLSLLRAGKVKPDFREIGNESLILSPVSRTFHGRDIFAPVAARLACGEPFENLGPEMTAISSLKIPTARLLDNGAIAAEVLYADSFGNLVTNVPARSLGLESAVECVLSAQISKDLKICPPQDIIVGICGRKIRGVSECYAQVNRRELVALVGSGGLLEIAVNGGSAAKTLDADPGTAVSITFAGAQQ